MDHEVPGDEFRITVEAGDPLLDARPNAAPATSEPEPVPQCPHRVRVRDLNSTGRLLYAGGMFALVLAWPVLIVGLFIGGFLLSLGAGFAGHFPITAGLALLLGAMLTTVGVFAVNLTWKRPHRPDPVMLWLSTAGVLLTLFGTSALGRWMDWHWAPAFTIPSALIAALLWYLRTLLDDRNDCEAEPDLPPQAERFLKPLPD
ncbi:hypothetical protein [Glycomyces harbinensis]|uniref:Uncharacterized protein n=1 Tax=Glycomyces harbinensis TaxID=58114 RepID=A0A1G6VBX0_9ACTN|nr:hypothetical protein [Glycomyces harbinensis]SDD51078.1 hypothetical protein SAMN05216270_104336 [Glycomyces harbinensis]